MENEYRASWDNTSIFTNLEDPQIGRSLERVDKNIAFLDRECRELLSRKDNIDAISELSRLRRETSEDLYQLKVFASCETSVNARNQAALDLAHQTDGLFSRFHQAVIPLLRFFSEVDGGWIDVASSPGEGSTFTIVLP